MCVDYSVNELIGSGAWRSSKSIGGLISETLLDAKSLGETRHVIFLKPKTFMNFNGGPVLKAGALKNISATYCPLDPQMAQETFPES